MASSQAYESGSTPQLPSDNTPNVPQQGITAIQMLSPPLIASHTHAHAPSTRASAGRPKTKPPWLLPGSKPNRPAPSSSISPNLGRMTRTNPAPFCALETSQPAPHDASSSVSMPAAMGGCSPPAERAGKRKAEDEAPPRDKEPRLASSAVKGRGMAMLIDKDEGLRIMKISEESRAAALAKNRRVTVAGGEARETDNPKRTKRAAAAALSDDDNGVSFYSLCGSARVMRALCVTVIAYWRSLPCSR